MLKVAIVASDPIVRFGVKAFLERYIQQLEVSEFENVVQCPVVEAQAGFGLVFLDLSIYPNKLVQLQQVQLRFTGSKVIVYDWAASFEQGVGFIKSGAHGFLPAISDLSILRTCVDRVLAGQFYLDTPDIDLLLHLLFRQKGLERKKGYFAELTPRQNEIALLLARGATTSDISRELGLQMSTVSTFRSIIYRKLNVQNIVELGAVMA